MAQRLLMTLGMKCPRPLFEVHKAIRDLAEGEQISVVADDPAFRLDIQAWCRRTGHSLVELQDERDRTIATIEKVG